MPAPEPMLSTRSARWLTGEDWVLQAAWDGSRLLVEIRRGGVVRAWSRHGASLGERVPQILEPFGEMPAGTIVDGELVALGERGGRPAQNFASVRRAVFSGDELAGGRLRFVAVDLLMIGGSDVRALSSFERDEQLRRSAPGCDVFHTPPSTQHSSTPNRTKPWLKRSNEHATELTATIVVGVDGSEASRDALRWAARQATLTGADLRVVMSWYIPASVYWLPMPEGMDPEQATRDILYDIVHETLGDTPTISVSTVVVEGHPAPVLIDESHDAELLVVGSRGHGEFTGMLLGSVSEHCVSHAACPVVVVRPMTRDE